MLRLRIARNFAREIFGIDLLLRDLHNALAVFKECSVKVRVLRGTFRTEVGYCVDDGTGKTTRTVCAH